MTPSGIRNDDPTYCLLSRGTSLRGVGGPQQLGRDLALARGLGRPSDYFRVEPTVGGEFREIAGLLVGPDRAVGRPPRGGVAIGLVGRSGIHASLSNMSLVYLTQAKII